MRAGWRENRRAERSETDCRRQPGGRSRKGTSTLVAGLDWRKGASPEGVRPGGAEPNQTGHTVGGVCLEAFRRILGGPSRHRREPFSKEAPIRPQFHSRLARPLRLAASFESYQRHSTFRSAWADWRCAALPIRPFASCTRFPSCEM